MPKVPSKVDPHPPSPTGLFAIAVKFLRILYILYIYYIDKSEAFGALLPTRLNIRGLIFAIFAVFGQIRENMTPKKVWK